MKKLLSVILMISFVFTALPYTEGSVEAESSVFVLASGDESSDFPDGDKVNGYTVTLDGKEETVFAVLEPVALDTYMFEYGYKYSESKYGVFGIALDKAAVDGSSVSDESRLTFHYRIAAGAVEISLTDENGKECGVIGKFTGSDRHGDAFWSPNISCFGFIKTSDGHWYLSVDGLVCNASENAALDGIIGATVFERHGTVYPFFGGYGDGTVYYKKASSVTEDNAITLLTDDSYGFYADGNREYRGQGMNVSDSRSAVVRYDFPKYISGSKTEGHEIAFTGTGGFAQTSEGFNLKTTVFKLSPITYDENTSVLYYYFGFATNPNAQKVHGVTAASDYAKTVDYRATSVKYINGNYDNYTNLAAVTDGAGMTVKYSAEERAIYWNSFCYDDDRNQSVYLDFVYDEEDCHWYMRSRVGGSYTVAKTVYFDDMINKAVYFRFGANSCSTDSFKMNLQVLKTDSDGNYTSAWCEESELPILSASEEKDIAALKNALSFGEITEASSEEAKNAAKEAYSAYTRLDAEAREYLTAEEKLCAESYAVLCFNKTTSDMTVSGNAADGFKISLGGNGRQRAIYTVSQPLGSLCFDYGYSYSGNLYGEFGITKYTDTQELPVISDEKNIVFFYRVSEGVLHINIRRNGYVEKTIAKFTADEMRAGIGYYSVNISSFGFAESDGHWYLTVDGMLCNNVEENSELARLDEILGKTAFENNEGFYIYVGGYNNGSMFFKPNGAVSSDNSWVSRSDDSYISVINGTEYELKGKGNTEKTVHYALPATPSADGDGHTLILNGTNGYMQSVYGCELSELKLRFSVASEKSTSYYLGFTANPSSSKEHGAKPSDTVEFIMTSYSGFTMGEVIENTKYCTAEPDTFNLGRIIAAGSIFSADDYKSSLTTVDFVEAVGADGEAHWYMRTESGGVQTVIKSSNSQTDKYLRFDELADKTVYVRLGSVGAAELEIYCEAEWCKAGALPSVTYTQEGFISEIKDILDKIPSESVLDIADNAPYIDRAYELYCKLTRASLEYFSSDEKQRIESLRSLLDGAENILDTDSDGSVSLSDVCAVKKAWLNGEDKFDSDGDGITDLCDAYAAFELLRPVRNTVYLSDYGAVGDGVTDDSRAIFAAVSALLEYGDDSRLVFEGGKSYYYAPGKQKDGDVIFRLSGCVNVHICGNGSRIITDAPARLLSTTDTVDCSVSGLDFTYKTRPYFMAANATDIDTSAKTCIMDIGEGTAADYLGFSDGVTSVTLPSSNFGIIESETGRMHMYISRYELTEDGRLKIYFASNTDTSWLSLLAEKRLICPTPGIAHTVSHAVHCSGDRDILFEDINIYSACKFAVAVMRSEGTVTFNSFNIVPDPEISGFEKTDFVCWRDGWHLKENHARVSWNNCSASGLQDDIFNISSSIMWVKEVIAPNEINMYWNETGGAFRADLMRGDRVTVINTETGEILAETEIAEIILQSGSENTVVLADSIDGLTAGESIQVLFNDLVANNSEINGGSYSGTWRFRGPITISNAYFDCRRMWLDVIYNLEGPIPHGIVFNNCEFDFDSSADTYAHASSYNSNTADGSYHISNIVFNNCRISPDNFEIGAGDEVIFNNCR